MEKHPRASYKFDFIKMELKEKGNNSKGVRYYIFPEFKKMFNDNKFQISLVYGNYEKEKLDINSKRMIIVGKKL